MRSTWAAEASVSFVSVLVIDWSRDRVVAPDADRPDPDLVRRTARKTGQRVAKLVHKRSYLLQSYETLAEDSVYLR